MTSSTSSTMCLAIDILLAVDGRGSCHTAKRCLGGFLFHWSSLPARRKD